MAYEPIGRIRPVPPTPSLLTSARPLSEDVNWSTGISWITSCIASFSQQYCPPGSLMKGAGRTVVHTMPFVIYTPISCTMPVSDGADLEALAVEATEAHTPAALAHALWMGSTEYDIADTTQPTLRRSAVDVSHASPVDLDDGVAALLTHYQLCTGGNGGAVVHMPGTMLAAALGGGNGGARLCWPEGNLYRGAHGSTFVAGPGYPEGFNIDGPNGAGPKFASSPDRYWGTEAGSAWIYVTGPIEYAVSNPIRIIPETERDRTTPLQNKYDFWAERDAIVRFDPCCVFAIEVWNQSPNPEVS